MDNGVWAAEFPSLVESAGAVYTAQLAAISRLVGMVCPGRHSMLTAFDLEVSPDGSSSAIEWEVTKADERFRAVTMQVSGGWLRGTVDAFAIPPPTLQPTFEELVGLVSQGEFAEQRALVVGGSRGLGEVSAKLIAAGGGDVMLTWHRGSREADRIVDEITDGGGMASSLQLDVSAPQPAIAQLSRKGWAASHLYYFASPKIFARRTKMFDPDLLSHFSNVYVTGFAHLLQACRAEGSQRLVGYYPSTVAVSEHVAALTEYAAAKAAGEVAANILSSSHRWLSVVVDRLPRMATDQTATVLPVPSEDPVPILLDAIRRMDRA